MSTSAPHTFEQLKEIIEAERNTDNGAMEV